jgi:hypothetical protein
MGVWSQTVGKTKPNVVVPADFTSEKATTHHYPHNSHLAHWAAWGRRVFCLGFVCCYRCEGGQSAAGWGSPRMLFRSLELSIMDKTQSLTICLRQLHNCNYKDLWPCSDRTCSIAVVHWYYNTLYVVLLLFTICWIRSFARCNLNVSYWYVSLCM